MNDQAKKIGKIILIIFGVIVGLIIVAQFFMSTIMANSNFGYDATPSEMISFSNASPRTALKSAAQGAMDAGYEMAAYNEDTGGDTGNGSTDKKIKKNGRLSLYVKNVEETVSAIKNLANTLNGFVLSSDINKSLTGEKSGYITIKVPVEKFDQAINDAKALATEVENESSDATDVTEEYTDLESQLKNLRAEEEQYLKILDKAENVEDILNVTNYLSQVRSQIEYTQGRINYLSRQTDMSTIYISLSTDADFEVFGLRWRPLIVAKRAVKNMLSGLTNYVDALIQFIILLPLIILWVVTVSVIIWIVWKILSWLYKIYNR